jgi:hypothetical protein
MRTATLVCVFSLCATAVFAQSRTVFSGVPSIKVSEGGTERLPETLAREKAVNMACVISEIGGEYYWASRENKQMVRMEGGAFITFLAADGSGYVRTIKPTMKDAAGMMSPTEKTFDYVEHLLLGLRSITYYGTSR